jgi:hypothetical protein
VNADENGTEPNTEMSHDASPGKNVTAIAGFKSVQQSLGQRGKSGPDAPQLAQTVNVRMNFDEDLTAASDLGEDCEFEHGILGAHSREQDCAVVIRSGLAMLLQPNAETGCPSIRSHEDDESHLQYAADTGNDGARLRPSVTGIVLRFIFFLAGNLEWWRARSRVRGSGGVRGSKLDAVVECVREIEGMDMDGEEGGELKQGESHTVC